MYLLGLNYPRLRKPGVSVSYLKGLGLLGVQLEYNTLFWLYNMIPNINLPNRPLLSQHPNSDFLENPLPCQYLNPQPMCYQLRYPGLDRGPQA